MLLLTLCLAANLLCNRNDFSVHTFQLYTLKSCCSGNTGDGGGEDDNDNITVVMMTNDAASAVAAAATVNDATIMSWKTDLQMRVKYY